ncbi:hypothetical protein AAF712_009430 [Marasmius tenuissimus]|uniref:DUF6535 domain-containing protein n=1 Tax=Marasmius tenuissimus TaxID=585030 RepID=A0ABR2ZPN2_9AGAR
MDEVDSLDDVLAKGFITAFTIESYQWLNEQPEDITVALLKQLSWQQINGTKAPDPEPFQVSTSVIFINVVWFFSLIVALVDALFALLCKQWLREHSRPTSTHTPAEELALHWFKIQSLEKWRILHMLTALPKMLELALFLFLAGLLELLRTRHPVPFAVAMVITIVAALFYVGTIIFPGLDIIRQAFQVTPSVRQMHTGMGANHQQVNCIMSLPPLEYTCPLKSPHAWAALQCFEFILSLISSPAIRMSKFLWQRKYISTTTDDHFRGLLETTQEVISGLSRWSSVDLELLQRSNVPLAPPFYELSALRWLVAELRNTPTMIPHLQNILSTIPLNLVMPGILDQWFFLPNREWAPDDIGTALKLGSDPCGIEEHISLTQQQCLDHFKARDKFNQLLHWVHVSKHISINDDNDASNHIHNFPRPQILLAPFSSIDHNLDDPLLSCLWKIHKQIGEDPAVQPAYLAGLMEDLGPYIIACSPDYVPGKPTATTSPFVKSDAGHEFLHKIHDSILRTKAFDRASSHDVVGNWMQAMAIVQCVHKLPEDHFKPLPGFVPLQLSKLEETLSHQSPINPETYFQYLDSFHIDWDNAHRSQREELVKILSEHINNPQSTFSSNTYSDNSKISPLVLSPEGLKLITMVNNRLAEDRAMYKWLSPQDRLAWHNAVQQIKTAQPDLLPDDFKDIFHEGLSPIIAYPFSLSLLQLQKVFSHQVILTTNSGANMSTIITDFKDQWDKAHIWGRRRLVELLSTHIIHPQSNPKSLINSDDTPSSVSPMVLELVVFVNNKLAEESLTWERLWENNQSAWRDALEHIRNVHGLPIDHFKPILHVTHSQPSPNKAGGSTNKAGEAKDEARGATNEPGGSTNEAGGSTDTNTPGGNHQHVSIQFDTIIGDRDAGELLLGI